MRRTATNAADPHRIPYREAIRRYGSDKPDLRNPLLLVDETEAFRASSFRLFADMLQQNLRAEVWVVLAPGGGTRAFCDRVNEWAREQGWPGVAYFIAGSSGFNGPVGKALPPGVCAAMLSKLNGGVGDSVLFIAGEPRVFYKFAGELRQKLAVELDVISKNRFEFCWTTDFPPPR